jgi:methionine-rich copper-binding protein CopC
MRSESRRKIVMKISLSAAIAASLVSVAPVPASAHALVSSTPAAGSTVTNLSLVTLNFSEPLNIKTSTASLTMTAMPGMADHPEMKMSAMKLGFGKDAKTILLRSAKPLSAGSYRLDWSSENVEGHKMTGRIAFTAK